MRLFFYLFVFLLSCSDSLTLHSHKPVPLVVVSVTPEKGQKIDELLSIRISLSQPVLPDSVNSGSFLVTSLVDFDLSAADPSPLLHAIENGEVVSHPGRYEFSKDNQEIVWIPDESLNSLTQHQIILTSHIQTPFHYPLNQAPGKENSPFVSWFYLDGKMEEGGNTPDLSENSASVGYEPPEEVVINEIYYDSADSDTDGNAFVELFGSAGGHLGGYVVRMINGADGKKTDEVVFSDGILIPEDSYFVLADTKTGSENETNVLNADTIENFDPQNGPDSIQLLDPFGNLTDVVGYGEGMVDIDDLGGVLYETAPALDVTGGFSLSRVDQGDTDNNSNDFVANETPSPGADFFSDSF